MKTALVRYNVNRRNALLLAISALAVSVFDRPFALANEASFATLTSLQLAAMLEKKDFFFVNVHTPYEGEIKNTDAFIVFDRIADNLDKLPKDKTARIVLYCRSGRMSEIAAGELAQLGFSQVSHLSGGMIDWKKSGHEVIEK